LDFPALNPLARSYGMDAAFMLLQRHGWDIHALLQPELASWAV